MASIHRDKRSRFWQAAWRDAGGRLFIRSTKIEHAPPHEDPKQRQILAGRNKRLAHEAAARFEAAARGTPLETQLRAIVTDIAGEMHAGDLFIRTRDFLEDWLKRAKATKKETSVARYRGVIRGFVGTLDAKAEGPLANVAPGDVERFIRARLEAGLNPSTVKVDLKILNTPFALALRQGVITLNPVAACEKVTAEQEPKTPFTVDEIRALAAAADAEWRTVILLGAFAGLRLGDAARLTWAAVDLPAKLLRLRPGKTDRKKRDLLVPMHPALEKHLMTLPAVDDPNAPLCPRLAVERIGSRNGLSRQFINLIREAGIEQQSVAATGKAGRTFNRRTFHSLRHSFVTGLENAGVGVDLRMKLAGHSTAAAHGRYTHTEIETLARAIEALPAL